MHNLHSISFNKNAFQIMLSNANYYDDKIEIEKVFF